MKLLKSALMIIVIYSCMIYVINVTVGLYVGIMTLAFLIAILPIIVPQERKMSRSEEQVLGGMKITLR